jgi:hypothetical protein
MNKILLLKSIAETGYNVGFGGRKHWATYDIVEKVPGLIGFFSTFIGIFSLVYETLSDKTLSAGLSVLGVVALYISFYDRDKDRYFQAANTLTQLYNSLRDLYRSVQSYEGDNFDSFLSQLHTIEAEYYSVSISKQILFSDWYAHVKFFWQYQIKWIEEQLHFTFFRDKIPLSFMLWISAIFVIATGFSIYYFPMLSTKILRFCS